MINRIARHLTAANVLSAVALGVALAGTGYAASAIPRNSVTTVQLAPGAVGPSDLAAGAVTSTALRNGSVRAADLAPSLLAGAVRGPRGLRGVDGTPGARGPEGPPGPQGPPGEVKLTEVVTRTSTTAVGYNGLGDLTVTCAAGEQVLGGGGGFFDGAALDPDTARITVSSPVSNSLGGVSAVDGATVAGWRLAAWNLDEQGQARELRAWVLCGRA